MTTQTKKRIDLNKIRIIIYNNIELLLDNLNINYENSGSNYFSTCPIHGGSDNKKALLISTEKKYWRCWTRSCHETHGKDIFDFIRATLCNKNGKDFTFLDTLKFVCKIYNIDYKNIEKEKTVDYPENDFVEIIKIFSKKENNLENSKVKEIQSNNQTSKYFEGRGFKRETLKYFNIIDLSDEDHEMKNRSIIPIHDEHSDLVAYIGRSTKCYITPKFIFTKGFKKSNYLYNYHRALDSICKKSCIFILEGQSDVWRMYEAGVENCVSIFGREISDVQKRKILKLNITTMVVLTDNDQAGRESKFKIQRQFSRMLNLKFPILNKKDVGDMTVEQVTNTILSQVKGLY